MRRAIIALLVLGAAVCVSVFLAAAGKAGALWPDRAGHPVNLILAGAAGLCFLVALIGSVVKAFPTQWWRALVVTAAGLSLALCAVSFAPWTVSAIVLDAVLLWGVIAKGWSPAVDGVDVASSPGDSARKHFLLHVPVPWVFVLAYFAGVGLQAAFPPPAPSAPLLLASHVIGGVLMTGGVALAAWCLGLFRAARTTTVPAEASCELVVSGPYRLSRNPMYVSLTLIYLGEAGLLAQVWPLLPLLLVFVYLNRVVIPVEEARLREVFGETYEHYCTRVRRWG